MEIVLFLVAIVFIIAMAMSNFGPTYHFKNDWKKPRPRGSAVEREAEQSRRIAEAVDKMVDKKGRHPEPRKRD